jgi:hypothetical protein
VTVRGSLAESLLLGLGLGFLSWVGLTALSEGSSFDKGVGVVSGGAGELVEEGFDDASGAVKLESMGMGDDEWVEGLGGGVLRDHAVERRRGWAMIARFEKVRVSLTEKGSFPGRTGRSEHLGCPALEQGGGGVSQLHIEAEEGTGQSLTYPENLVRNVI